MINIFSRPTYKMFNVVDLCKLCRKRGSRRLRHWNCCYF